MIIPSLSISSPVSSEFWFGLDRLHTLTKNGSWNLKVEIKYNSLVYLQAVKPSPRCGTWGIGVWENFSIGSEDDSYKLSIGKRVKVQNMRSYDPFLYQNGMSFTTTDRDNDKSNSNCAKKLGYGGWWYKKCYKVCLTCKPESDGLWAEDSNKWETLSYSLMWIKQAA